MGSIFVWTKRQVHVSLLREKGLGRYIPVLKSSKQLMVEHPLLETKIQVKMEKLSSTTKGICELEKYYCGEGGRRPPLFHTWPAAHFYEVARQLCAMYGEELRLKRTIVAELAHTTDRDLALTYLSLWLHQPCVRSDSKLLLESMLLETGHRAL